MRRMIHFPIELLKLAAQDEEAWLQLRLSNPALLVLIASTYAQDPLWGIGRYREILRLPQRKILRRLGYPPHWWRLLRKVRSELLMSHTYIQLLQVALRKPHMARLLSHVAEINGDVLMLAVEHFRIVVDSPELLARAATNDWALATPVYQQVDAIVTARRAIGKRPFWPYRKLPRDLSLAAAGMHRAATLAGIDLKKTYPAPPVNPDLEWTAVADSHELQEVAEQFRNCARDLQFAISSGMASLYYSTQLDEDAVCVLLEFQGEWRVTQVVGIENALVEPARKQRIRAHFNAALATEGGRQ